jgi:hypothetical protein
MDSHTAALLERLLSFSPLEKNLLYHQILTILRQSPTSEQAAPQVLQAVTEFLRNKKFQLEEVAEAATAPASPASPAKVGKVFRRVG